MSENPKLHVDHPIPDTDSVVVAKIAAALMLVRESYSVNERTRNLEASLKRFSQAFAAISEAVGDGESLPSA